MIEELEVVLPELEKLENVQIVGLMTMAPFEASHEELNQNFEKAHQLQKIKEETVK